MADFQLPLTFKLPLSGDVTQTINPWTMLFNPVGSQVGLININVGQSSNPAAEAALLDEVGSYGKQLGRIGDALAVLLKHFKPEGKLSAADAEALKALSRMLEDIDHVKGRFA